MKNFSKKEYLNKKKDANKIAIYEAIYKPNRIFLEILRKYKNKKILIAGTNDHTYALLKNNEKHLVDRSIDYFEYSFNDFLKSYYNIKGLKQVKNIKNIYDVIIISSFEYDKKIKENIKKKYNNLNIFSIYDNCSRSVMDAYLIRKNGGIKKSKNKRKLYEKGILQNL